jgi:hypothetical protein
MAWVTFGRTCTGDVGTTAGSGSDANSGAIAG